MISQIKFVKLISGSPDQDDKQQNQPAHHSKDIPIQITGLQVTQGFGCGIGEFYDGRIDDLKTEAIFRPSSQEA